MAAEHDRDAPGGSPLTGVDAAVELVFCSTSHNVVELDCRTVSGPCDGWPFTMRLGLPQHAAWSAAAERMLTRWAEEGAVVTIDLRAARRPATVRIAYGDAAVVLDAVAPGAAYR